MSYTVPEAKIEELRDKIKLSIILIAEKSFKKYIKGHTGITKEQVELEWKRYRRILEKNL